MINITLLTYYNNSLIISALTLLRAMATAATCSTQISSVIRGHHFYKQVWTPFVGERLEARKEYGNKHCSFAVAIIKKGSIVGRVPLEFSLSFWTFLTEGGEIICEVSGKRKKGKGLEVPCTYHLTGTPSVVQRLEDSLEED